ncbi:rRNA maturation RNase YbeY [bacterium]|nr:rRNA maturation RNase YbeY [bacterium]
MKIRVRNLQSEVKVSLRTIKRAARETLRLENQMQAEVSIISVTDDYIRNLNREYRHRDQVTDVLAFAMGEGEFSSLNPHLLGDVVISAEMAKGQAEQFGESLDKELARLVIHGVLHLLGYDDVRLEDKKRMETKQEEVLKLCYWLANSLA